MLASKVGGLGMLAFALLEGCSSSNQVAKQQTLEGSTMGTTYTIRYVPELSSTDPEELHRLIDIELARVNQQMSTYIEDSEVSIFNQSSSTDWISVSVETAQVVELARQISVLSDGAFDVTVAPLVNLWGFGPVKRPDGIPEEKDIEAARSLVGYQFLAVRLDPPALKKSVSGLNIDLSAIAKGHGVDRVGKVLSKYAINHYFVEIGGEIAARGTRPDGGPWRVGIEMPSATRSIQSIVGLSNATIATSGDYRNYFEHEGQRFSHTIDPTTGRPVSHTLASASVIADDCAFADAVATSMMVVGLDAGLKLAELNNWSVLLIGRDDDRFTTTCSSQFAMRFPGVCKPAVARQE